LRDNVCDVRRNTQQLSHTPDGAFALEKDGKAVLFFVEIDRGDEVVSDPNKGVLKSIVFISIIGRRKDLPGISKILIGNLTCFVRFLSLIHSNGCKIYGRRQVNLPFQTNRSSTIYGEQLM
jgi:hypothetical protein